MAERSPLLLELAQAVDELLHRLAHTLVPDDDDGSGVAAVVAAIELLLGAPRYWSKPYQTKDAR